MEDKLSPFTVGVIVLLISFGVAYSSNAKNAVSAYNPSPIPSVSKITTKEYKIADVAMHKTSADCWTAINGSVYNVTSWIPQHPGGAKAIISLCGIDGSAAFNDQHGVQKRPANELANFKIGVLIK